MFHPRGEISEDLKFKVYRNPNHGELMVEWTNPTSESSDIRVFSSTGQVVLITTTEPKSSSQKLDLSDLTQEIYFLQIISADQVLETQKFIKL